MSNGDSKIIEQFRRRTPGSAALAAEASEAFPGGVTHDSRHQEPYPIFVDRAAGSRKWDVDGNEYVDYSGGHGALLLGHNHPEVVQAVTRQLPHGTHFGACHESEVRWAQLVQRMIPSAERVRFTNSGTEATMLAMRLARAFTGRSKIMRFAGHFHGWHDHAAFGVSSHLDGTPTPGVLRRVAEEVVLAPAANADVVERLFQAHSEIAAVIIEPTGASWGQVPVTPEFLSSLRDITHRRDAVLIFDEVISGFRCSPGGLQAAVGITPDLTTLAKILAGGLPGGALVGRRDIMDGLSFSSTGGKSREKVAHQGTFNANPLSAAAGIATLEVIAGTDACERANDYARRLRAALSDVLRDEGVNWCVYGSYSGFHIFTNPQHLDVTSADIEAGRYGQETLKAPTQPGLLNRLRVAMLLHGVEIFGWPGGPTSAVHTDEDLRLTADAFRGSIRMLKDELELEAPASSPRATT